MVIYQYMVKTTKGDRHISILEMYCTTLHSNSQYPLRQHHQTRRPTHPHTKHSKSKGRDCSQHHIKDRSKKETTPIPTIYEEERAKLRSADYIEAKQDHEDVIAELPSIYEFRMTFYRARNTRDATTTTD